MSIENHTPGTPTELDQWDEVGETAPSLTLEQMDRLVQELALLKADVDSVNEVLETAKELYETKRKYVLDSLKANNREKYSVEGVGTVYINAKESYRIPKINEDKTKLFNYIKAQYGSDALMSMVNIHSATLTSWANAESEKGVMSIPGLEAPTMMETLNFRRR